MAITSESQLIDTATIKSGCNTIRAAVKDYTACANKVKEAHDTCTAEALSIEKQTLQPTIEDVRAAIADIETQVNTLLGEIESVAAQVHTEQYEELQAYKAAQQAQQSQQSSGN